MSKKLQYLRKNVHWGRVGLLCSVLWGVYFLLFLEARHDSVQRIIIAFREFLLNDKPMMALFVISVITLIVGIGGLIFFHRRQKVYR